MSQSRHPSPEEHDLDVAISRSGPTRAEHPYLLSQFEDGKADGSSTEALKKTYDDETQAILQTQSQVMPGVEEDDPHFDWRMQDPDSHNEDYLMSDPDEIPDPSPGFEVPYMIRQAEAAAETVAVTKTGTVHARYTDFLAKLCHQTDTFMAETHVKDGLPHVQRHTMSLCLDQDYVAHSELDIYAHAAVIYVWLAVCQKFFQDTTLDSTSTDALGSFSLSAFTIAKTTCHTSKEELAFAVLYWETRFKAKTTGNAWLQEVWFRDIPGQVVTQTPRNEDADQYLQALEKGRLELLRTIIQSEGRRQDAKPLQRFRETSRQHSKWAPMEVADILVSMDMDVLRALIDGSLIREYEIPSGWISQILQEMENQRPPPPSIYQNSICDGIGMSPTPLQWEVVCGQMRVYVQGGTESDELAEKVDQLISPSADWPARLAREGLRRYTEWLPYNEGHGDKSPSSVHRQMVRYFASQMEARIAPDLQAGRGHVPLTAPVIEIGFSSNHVKRCQEH